MTKAPASKNWLSAFRKFFSRPERRKESALVLTTQQKRAVQAQLGLILSGKPVDSIRICPVGLSEKTTSKTADERETKPERVVQKVTP